MTRRQQPSNQRKQEATRRIKRKTRKTKASRLLWTGMSLNSSIRNLPPMMNE